MNNRKLHSIAIGLILLIAVTGLEFAEAWAAEKAEQHVTVAVKKMPDGLSINPIRVKRGEPVIWVNHDPEPIKIKILTKLGIACAAPINFYADLFGHYESIQIAQHAVASICFLEKGEYTYEAHRSVKFGDKVDEEIIPGKIIVE